MTRWHAGKDIAAAALMCAACILLAGCTSPKQGQVRLVQGRIVYTGPVDHAGKEDLLRLLKETGAARFFIDSPGGSAEAGLEIGEFISRNSIAVTVLGDCHSACANYILLASRHREAVASARIGLHGGYQSFLLQQRRLLEKLPEEHKALYREAIRSSERNFDRERQLLAAAGVDPDIIKKSAEMTYFGTTMYNVVSNGNTTRYTAPAIVHTDFELWFPPQTEYELWGIQIAIAKDPMLTAARPRHRHRSVSISREPARPERK